MSPSADVAVELVDLPTELGTELPAGIVAGSLIKNKSLGKYARSLPDTASPLKRGVATRRKRLFSNSRAARPQLRMVGAVENQYRHEVTSADVVKRTIDVVFGATMLVLLFPLMVATFIALKFVSPGPSILRQRRLTQGNKEFTIYKFRTMSLDAEKHSGAVMASENDTRIFPFGRFMRKTRLDELPQLINVLRGEMSLVGPRPERPEIAKSLEQQIIGFNRRTRVKAGLTGLAQVEAGYSSCVDSYRKKMAYDVVYVRSQSLLLDLSILVRTITVIFSCKGAR